MFKNYFNLHTLKLLSFVFLCFITTAIYAQDSTKVKFEGVVFDFDTKSTVSYFMIINKSTGSGTFGESNGKFVLYAHSSDTIIIGAHGYTSENYILPSPPRGSNIVNQSFYLKKLSISIPEVVIIPERELKDIKKDIDELGYEEKDYRISGVNAIEHPITFLYQMFSKRERSYRKVAELENEDRRRSLLKELFKKYIAYDIIALNNEDFDDFIDYCNISDFTMQHSSQYEFINIIKTRYRGFQIYSKRRKASPVYKHIHNE